jgi:hypothetical protein
MRCRRLKHVIVALPCLKPTRAIQKLSPDFRGETSATKHANSETNPSHARQDDGDCSSCGLSWDWTWVSTVRNRLNHDTADSFKESSDKKHAERVQDTIGLYLSGIFLRSLILPLVSFPHTDKPGCMDLTALWQSARKSQQDSYRNTNAGL